MSNTPTDKLRPFSLKISPQVPELLYKLQATIAISTYQAGKLIFLSAGDPERLIQLPRTFPKPMGIGLSSDGQKLALAVRDRVIVFYNSRELAWHYPKKPATYDALYLPRVVYLTNPLDIHDLDWVGGDLMAVNTMFSCIIKLTDSYNFEVVWKPPFIDRIASEDRCHLNGMAIEDGQLRYVTAFSTTNTPMGWKKTIPDSGVVMDIETGDIVAEKLAMPHTPKIVEGRLLILLSATGQLVEVDRKSGAVTEIRRIQGFVRGMAYHREYLFIGHSRLRKRSSSFGKLELPYEKSKAGITILHLPTGAIAGQITYEQSVDEIYDLRVIPMLIRPNILNTEKEDYKLAVSTPEKTYWARPSKEETHEKRT